MRFRYKRKRSTKFRKKRYSAKRRIRRFGRISKLKLNRSTGFPDTVLVKLKYVDYINLTNIAGVGTYSYRINSLYDPDFSGAGHQPLGFDQWSGFYSHYQVSASRIRVQVLPPDANVVGFAIYPSRDAVALGSYSAAREQPYSRSKWVTSATSVVNSTVSNYMKVKKLEARSIDSVNFSAAVTANPTQAQYWHMVLNSVTGTDISDIRLDIQITYYAKFFRRNTLTPS